MEGGKFFTGAASIWGCCSNSCKNCILSRLRCFHTIKMILFISVRPSPAPSETFVPLATRRDLQRLRSSMYCMYVHTTR